MSKFLSKVTVTGADDSVTPKDLLQLQQQFPFAEFGILLSSKYSSDDGGPRFPSREWLIKCVSMPVKLHLSGHFCGQWVRDFMSGKWPDIQPISFGIRLIFKRFQFNTHGEAHSVNTLDMCDRINRLHFSGDHTVIFQLDGKTGNEAALAAIANGNTNIAGLFDLSHGAGLLPQQWPKPIAGLKCGYAGGLSPENVAAQLERIEEVAGDDSWVDAETHLRDGNKFSLVKCEAFLKACEPWVK